MLQALKLLLPALIPSWRFFDTIAPSPRIEFTLLKTTNDAHGNWQEFRPRPAYLSITSMLKRMLWNPSWNESLFLVSCAERLMANPTEHSIQEILSRIKAELTRSSVNTIADSIYDWTRRAGYRTSGAYLNVGEHANIPQRQRPGIKSIGYKGAEYLQFRLVFLSMNGKNLQKHITYISKAHKLFGNTDS